MKKYTVIKILGEPQKTTIRINDTMIADWGVDVVLQHRSKTFESTITFDKCEDAQKLKVGDVFER